MITGMLAVRNLIYGEKQDLWNINGEQEYHEEIYYGKEEKLEDKLKQTIIHVFPRLDPVAFGLSAGLIAGLSLALATLFLVIKGGEVVGPHLQVLAFLLPGYTVSIFGSLVGLIYLFVTGFVLGSGFAYLRNLIVLINARVIHRDIEIYLLRRLFDYL